MTILKSDLLLTNKKYKVIYADPPWDYKDKANAGKRGASHKYETMSQEKLYNMMVEIDHLATKDSVLFLWSTYPMMPEALALMSVWGFHYKTIAFTWVKKTKKGKDHFGMGHWTRANPEVCLLGVRGKPKVKSHKVRNLFYSQVEEHSKKPDIVRKYIEELIGKCNRVELFARKEWPNWDSWGKEFRS